MSKLTPVGSPPSKKPRRVNFINVELEVLTDEAVAHMKLINAPFSSIVTLKMKNQLWDEIAQKVNAVGGANRTGPEVRKKWNELKCNTKKKAQVRTCEATKTGGGPAPAEISDMDVKILSAIPDCQITGIEGGQESSIFEDVKPSKATRTPEKTNTPSVPVTVVATVAELVEADFPTAQERSTAQERQIHVPRSRVKVGGPPEHVRSVVEYEGTKTDLLRQLVEVERERLDVEKRRLVAEERLASAQEKLVILKKERIEMLRQVQSNPFTVSPVITFD